MYSRQFWLSTIAAVLLGGCATLEGDDFAVYDHHESFNRTSYDISDSVDRNVLVPVARGYQKVMPDFVEKRVSNVFANLRTLGSSANGFLQGKPRAGGEDFGRFIVNSTIGLAGLFDPASDVGLRYQEEDFGQTLAVWGWRKSRFVYVPFLGPATIRDLPSTIIRGYIPRLIIGSDYPWPASVVDLVNARAALLTTTDVRDASALDPYTFTRDGYIQRRKYLIYDGDPPLDDLFDEFDDFGDEE
ncbi:MAG: VacJ family lipoprotein [Pseudomonadales bacterium]|nr:VacJ family lipoprotein [Pseudomonadales bacterium]